MQLIVTMSLLIWIATDPCAMGGTNLHTTMVKTSWHCGLSFKNYTL